MIYTDFRRFLANLRIFVYPDPFLSFQASGAGVASFGYNSFYKCTAGVVGVMATSRQRRDITPHFLFESSVSHLMMAPMAAFMRL